MSLWQWQEQLLKEGEGTSTPVLLREEDHNRGWLGILHPFQ